jgi:hypothetical protein
VTADVVSQAPVLLLLGAWHGVNPAMGWLFAVALGLQERRRRAMWRALPAFAAGHVVAVAAALLVAAFAGVLLPLDLLRWTVALLLAGVGLHRLVRPRHPRFGGMRMGAGGFVAWSALVASAHGAGLMVVPFLLGTGGTPASGAHAMHAALAPVGAECYVLAAAIHTVGYVGMAAGVAAVVYEKLGLRLLGRAWLNLDLVWGAAMVLTGAATAAGILV